MVRAMKLRDVKAALQGRGCAVLSDRGTHSKWGCPCKRHTANVPRHTVISPGVVRDIGKRMACLPEGWSQ